LFREWSEAYFPKRKVKEQIEGLDESIRVKLICCFGKSAPLQSLNNMVIPHSLVPYRYRFHTSIYLGSNHIPFVCCFGNGAKRKLTHMLFREWSEAYFPKRKVHAIGDKR